VFIDVGDYVVVLYMHAQRNIELITHVLPSNINFYETCKVYAIV